MELIGSIIVLAGSIFLFLGALGVLRMPDSYTRIQAGTKASTLVLMLLAQTRFSVNHKILTAVESISGFSYVIIGILGVLLAGGFLDNSILPMGEFGTLLSAGAIPVIYIFIGLKVGSELSNIVRNLYETQKEV